MHVTANHLICVGVNVQLANLREHFIFILGKVSWEAASFSGHTFLPIKSLLITDSLHFFSRFKFLQISGPN